MQKEKFHGIDVKDKLKIRGRKGYGVSIALSDGKNIETYCTGSGRFGQYFPVNPDMMFQAGSVSKPAFALTLLRYVDKGKIDLDADISGIVPEFVKIPMTLTALLSHTAGFNLHGFPGYRADAPSLSLEDVLNGKGNTPRLRRIRPYGGQYMYSGGGTTLAELVFTRVTGETLRDAFQKEVAEPLGLTHTGYFQPLDDCYADNAAFGGRLGIKEDAKHGWHYYPEHAAAGLWTTPTELVKIGIELGRCYRGEGSLLKKETAKRMLTPVLENYGLCVENFRGDIGYHGGCNEGFLTEWFFSLRTDLCVASITNRSYEAIDIAQVYNTLDIFQIVEDELYPLHDKKAWKKLCGKYKHSNPDFCIDEIFMQDDSLYARIIDEEDGEFTSRLYPIGDKTFGRFGGFAKIEFRDDCLVLNGTICKKKG